MELLGKNWSVDLKIAFNAYLLSVTYASLSFTLLLECFTIISGGGFELATGNDFFTKAQHLLVMTMLFFTISWVFTFVTAILPFLFGIMVSNQFKISNRLYFASGSSLTAAMLCSLFVNIPELGIDVQPPEPSFWQKYFRALPFFLASGSIVGLVCWKYIIKKVK